MANGKSPHAPNVIVVNLGPAGPKIKKLTFYFRINKSISFFHLRSHLLFNISLDLSFASLNLSFTSSKWWLLFPGFYCNIICLQR